MSTRFVENTRGLLLALVAFGFTSAREASAVGVEIDPHTGGWVIDHGMTSGESTGDGCEGNLTERPSERPEGDRSPCAQDSDPQDNGTDPTRAADMERAKRTEDSVERPGPTTPDEAAFYLAVVKFFAEHGLLMTVAPPPEAPTLNQRGLLYDPSFTTNALALSDAPFSARGTETLNGSGEPIDAGASGCAALDPSAVGLFVTAQSLVVLWRRARTRRLPRSK